MNTQIKPLEWTVFCSRSGNSVAKTPFGEYVIQIEPDGWCLYLLNSDDPHASYSMSDFAKAAAQSDYETRILSALISSPGKDGGQEVEAVGWETDAERDLENRAFSVANNREVPEHIRTLVEDLWRQYCIAAEPQPASTALVERLTKALEPFCKHYEPWMERWDDQQASSTFSRHTFGDLREALAAINEARSALSASTSREGESRG